MLALQHEHGHSKRGSQTMNHARRILQLAAMPVFLALAVISYVQPSPICTVPGPYGFLTSMWFMFSVMAVTHSGEWLPLVAKLVLSSRPIPLQPFGPCCSPSIAEAPKRRERHRQSPWLA